jgi:ubiquinone/menaquinone biosynthesis C-methylase UbiE
MNRLSWAGRLYLWACHRLYDQLAWAYDAVSWLVSAGAWSDWRRLALDYVGPGETLEIGFGTGELLAEMAARGLPVVGVEPSAAMQRITGVKLRRRGVAARRVVARAERLPFPANTFTAVVATFPAEYISRRETLCELARVLRPPRDGGAGGRLVIVGMGVALNHPALRRLLPIFYGTPPPEAYARWRAALAEAGLSLVVVERVCGWATLPVLVAEKVG